MHQNWQDIFEKEANNFFKKFFKNLIKNLINLQIAE